MNNTLIDNSAEQLSMLHSLKDCFALQDINTVKIATGYWDIPGLALLTDSIKAFLEKEGTSEDDSKVQLDKILMAFNEPFKVWTSTLEEEKNQICHHTKMQSFG